MSKMSACLNALKRLPLWVKIAAGLVLAGGLAWALRGERAHPYGAVFTARRGPLEIAVLQGGSTEAAEAEEYKCEVRGFQTKILKLVEEGYRVTDADVTNSKVLVELDASEIRKQVTQQDIQFESTISTLRDAQETYDIQLNQNVSDIQAAEQKARFARMDFEKFIGDSAAVEILETVSRVQAAQARDLAARSASAPGGTNAAGVRTNAFGAGTNRARAVLSAAPVVAEPAELRMPAIDFSKYKRVEALSDGEAKQKLRKFLDDVQLSEREFKQAQTTLEGTRRLFTNDFVTKTELEGDEIKLENVRLKLQTAESARDLFLKYEFVKSAEENLSKYLEAARELDRTRKGAVSKLAQAQAKLKAAEGRYNLEVRQSKEAQEQIERCSIRARKPGLVVYGGRSRMWFDPSERIREGATVHEQMPILTIPDLSLMSVKVRVHETYIKKVRKGLPVRVTVDAFPDTVLEGEVSKVGVLPDSRNEWMSPDMKVYLTTIDIKGVLDWLKPGMSCKVEIVVSKLTNVVYVPIQAVFPQDKNQYCQVLKNGRPERREVKIGEFNDEFIVVESGVKEGERVLLRAPDGAGGGSQANGEAGRTAEPVKPEAARPAAAAAAPAKAGGR